MCDSNLSSGDVTVDARRELAEAALLRELELLGKCRRDLNPDQRPDTYSAGAAGGGSGSPIGALRSTNTNPAFGVRSIATPKAKPPNPSIPAGYMYRADDLDTDHRPSPKRWTPVVEVPVELIAEIDRACPSATDRRLRDRLLYLVSLTCDPTTAHEESDYQVRLYSVHLADACGEHRGKACYRDLGRELEVAGLLEVGESYSNAKTRARAGSRRQPGKAKPYTCLFPWLGAPRARLRLETMSLTFRRAGLAAALAASDSALRYLAACYLQSSLDAPHALRLLCAEHRLPPDLAAGPLDEEHRMRLSQALAGNERGQAALSSIVVGWVAPAGGEPWFGRDRTAGRLHSPVTNLASYLRPALRLCGSDRLVSLDLKCSQPTIAAAWMLTDRLDQTADGADWLRLVQYGDIYAETFRAVFDRHPTKAERDEWKRTLFREWWYARVQVQSQGEVGRALGEHWPTVHQWILARKAHEEGGHSAFPIELQAREAEIFIDDLALRLEAAGIPALTIHDSLIVREEDAERAEAEMRAALAVLRVRVQIERKLIWAA